MAKEVNRNPKDTYHALELFPLSLQFDMRPTLWVLFHYQVFDAALKVTGLGCSTTLCQGPLASARGGILTPWPSRPNSQSMVIAS